jgi:hypothetical protein
MEHADDAAAALLDVAVRPDANAIRNSLEVLRRCFDHDPGTTTQLWRHLAGSPEPSARLVAVGWMCVRADGPFAPFAERLLGCRTWLDRLLWLQAVVETFLHLLAACAIVDGCARRALQKPDDFALRPNLGDLCVAAASLSEPTSGDVHPFGLALAESGALDDANALRREFAEPLNRVLHEPFRWLDARSDVDGGPLRDTVATIASHIVRRLEGLGRTLTKFPFERHEDRWSIRLDADGTRRLDLHGMLLALDAPDGAVLPCFYRGMLGPDVARYWALSSPARRYVRPNFAGRLHDAPWSPEGRAALAAGESYQAHWPTPLDHAGIAFQALPTPLAQAVRGLQCGRNDAIDTVAALDFLTAALLRLVWFAVWPTFGSAHRLQGGDQKWLSRMSKRALFNALNTWTTRPERDARACSLSEHLLPADSGERILSIIDALERLEHAPGPLRREEHDFAAIEALLHDVLRVGPWAVGWTLVGGTPDGVQRLHGIQPGRYEMPPDLTLRAGEVVWHRGSQILSLWPFVLYERRGRRLPEVRLLAHAPTRSKSLSGCAPEYVTRGMSGQYARHRRKWIDDEGAPLGVGVKEA